MGGGSWSTKCYATYSASIGRSYNATTDSIDCSLYNSAQDMYVSKSLDKALNPYKVIRECCDSDEHKNTFPVILALDVTGSMGDTAMEVAKCLNKLMTQAYKSVKDIEFAVMGIGDLRYDSSPIQLSQFESDIRIAENLDKIYFEAGGGGNSYESYTAAWWAGLNQTKLDCWKRGKKGVIITLGDEYLNPYLPYRQLNDATGSTAQADVETKKLYEAVKDKYNIYHIVVEHGYQSQSYWNECRDTFAEVIGKDNVFISKVNGVVDTLSKIIAIESEANTSTGSVLINENNEISW